MGNAVVGILAGTDHQGIAVGGLQIRRQGSKGLFDVDRLVAARLLGTGSCRESESKQGSDLEPG